MTGRPIYLLATGNIPALATANIPTELIVEASGRQVVVDVVNYIEVEDVGDVGGWESGDLPLSDSPLSDSPLSDSPLSDSPLSGSPLSGSRVAVFTSVHAVEAVRERLAVVSGWRIYCIGGATREAAAGIFGEGSIAGSAGSARELAELIKERGEGGVVFFCGDRRRDELPEVLTRAGIRVDERVVYRTRLTPKRVDRDYAGVAFFSPSAVESFFSVNTIGAGVILFAIGGTTAAAIHDRCSNEVVTSERPDKTVLIKLMTDHFLNQR
jgi:uroporphyrinogen-III synthase